MEKGKGSKFVKVMGILAIIFCGISVIATPVTGCAACAAIQLATELGGGGSVALIGVSIAIGMIASIMGLVAGIIAVANANKPEKIKVMMCTSIIYLALEVVAGILLLIAGSSSFFSVLIGWVLPILLFVAVLLMKNGKADEVADKIGNAAKVVGDKIEEGATKIDEKIEEKIEEKAEEKAEEKTEE